MVAARALCCAALVVATVVMAGCHNHYPIDVTTVHHDPRNPVLVKLRDGTVVEALATPRADGRGWLLGTDEIPGRLIASTVDGPPLRGTLLAREVRVTLTDGSTVRALALTSGVGSARIVSHYVRARWVPHPDVVGVDGRRRGMGLLAGLGLGLAGGVVVGGIVGATAYEQPECARPGYENPNEGFDICLDLGASTYMAGGAVIGGVVGGLVGAIVGSARGYRTSYGRVPAKGRLTVAPAPGGGSIGLSGRF